MAKKGRPVGSKNKKSGYFHTTSKPMGVIKRKSTRATVIAHLEKFGYITKKSAEDLYNVNNFYQVISNLRGDGFHIELKRGVNGVAEYHLLNEKDLFQDATVPMEWSEVVETVNKPEPKVEVEPENMKVKTSMKEVILDHLKKHKTITSAIAMKKYRCLNLCTIIGTLRGEGYNISRSRERKSSDYNTASNRNNSYVVYTLENKMRAIDTYGVSMTYEAPISNFVPATFEMFDNETDVLGYANSIADNIIKSCELLCGSSVISFGKKYYPTEKKIIVLKIETTKRLFKKKYKETQLASIAIHKVKTEIADSLTFV